MLSAVNAGGSGLPGKGGVAGGGSASALGSPWYSNRPSLVATHPVSSRRIQPPRVRSMVIVRTTLIHHGYKMLCIWITSCEVRPTNISTQRDSIALVGPEVAFEPRVDILAQHALGVLVVIDEVDAAGKRFIASVR